MFSPSTRRTTMTTSNVVQSVISAEVEKPYSAVIAYSHLCFVSINFKLLETRDYVLFNSVHAGSDRSHVLQLFPFHSIVADVTFTVSPICLFNSLQMGFFASNLCPPQVLATFF